MQQHFELPNIRKIRTNQTYFQIKQEIGGKFNSTIPHTIRELFFYLLFIIKGPIQYFC